MIVSASLMSADLLNLNTQLRQLEEIKGIWVHIDMMDGYFTKNVGFGRQLVDEIASRTSLYTDVHLMVQEPLAYARILSAGRVRHITFHTDTQLTVNQNKAVIRYVKEQGKNVGVTVRKDTDIKDLQPYLAAVDSVLVVCTEIGYGAQNFSEESLLKLQWLKLYRANNHLAYQIQVDGGVNGSIAASCRDSGADILVSGSYVFGGEGTIAERVRGLQSVE